MFDDEYDLAIALIETIDSRAQRRGYAVERLIEHDVAVSIHETFHLKRIDEDFFAEAEI